MADDGGIIDGRQVGALCHQVTAALLAAGHRSPDAATIWAAVGAHPVTRSQTVYRAAARQSITGVVALYPIVRPR
ncbi:MAG: hypothetical protein JWR63_4471 [Conexibacter sp.]|nr:hypothetical protein [Conexibacter sp.]